MGGSAPIRLRRRHRLRRLMIVVLAVLRQSVAARSAFTESIVASLRCGSLSATARLRLAFVEVFSQGRTRPRRTIRRAHTRGRPRDCSGRLGRGRIRRGAPRDHDEQRNGRASIRSTLRSVNRHNGTVEPAPTLTIFGKLRQTRRSAPIGPRAVGAPRSRRSGNLPICRRQ